MNFKEAYASLKKELALRVEEDKAHGSECIFLPNVEPTGPVDYVLIGMEPSLGGFAKGKGDARIAYAQSLIDEGFRNFCGVWILHHAAINILRCADNGGVTGVNWGPRSLSEKQCSKR